MECCRGIRRQEQAGVGHARKGLDGALDIADPIGSGFVADLARPGGNITGLLQYEEGISGKWLAMLKEIAPRLTRAALVANPKTTIYD